jgi:hypothetical protein
MRYSRHLRGGDARAAVEGREDLAERDHLAADAGFPLHKGNLESLVTKIEGSLHAGDSAADHERIYMKILHNGSFPAKLSPAARQVHL